MDLQAEVFFWYAYQTAEMSTALAVDTCLVHAVEADTGWATESLLLVPSARWYRVEEAWRNNRSTTLQSEGDGMQETPASKETVVLKLLEEGDTMLCLDARRPGVHVPPQHAHDPALRLILNLNFPRPIEVTAAGISASLAFGGRRFACFIPMEALWAVFNPQTMQGTMWPESMPPEVRANLTAAQPAGQQDTPIDTPEQPVKPRIRVEKGRKKTPKTETEPPPPRQRGHLRVIK